MAKHCKATNVACLAELNRHPLKARIKILAIKFWEHITNSSNTLVNKIYNNVNPNNTWNTTIHKWINELGFGYLISNTSIIKQKIDSIKQRITDQAIQNQYSCLKENNKLIFYRKIYRMNERPPYVDVCKFRTDRSIICKFRIN